MEEKVVKVVFNGKEWAVFTRQVIPSNTPEFDILLLHGQSFTSKNWEDIGTLQLLGDSGYRAIAVDLPGYGKSTQEQVENRGEFLEALIKTVGLEAPVIISPSMNGLFSLPYIFNGEASNVSKRARAYVPIAPIYTSEFKERYQQFQIPTLILRGDRDLRVGTESVENLKELPNRQIHIIKDAGHACYMNNPDDFHKLLSTFLKGLRH